MTGWTDSDIPPQDGRTVLITGASSGLGHASAVALAARGARVLMGVRDPARGAAALARLRAQVPGAAAETVPLDLASLASVARAADDVGERVDALDVLMANAGVMAVPRRLTEDGVESQFATNHLGHFALTGRLLPLLLRAGGTGRDARVVVTSSSAHRMGRLDLADLAAERAYGRWRAYGASKLANLLFVRELDARLRARDLPLLAVAAHPGYAATNLQKGQGSPLLEGAMRLGNLLFAQSERAGAWPQLYAATMPDVQGGEYLGPDGRGEARGHPTRVGRSEQAQDDVAARRLWERSEQLTGVRYEALG